MSAEKNICPNRKVIIRCNYLYLHHWYITFILFSFATAQITFEKVMHFTNNYEWYKIYVSSLSLNHNYFYTSLNDNASSSFRKRNIFLVKTDTLGNIIKSIAIDKNYSFMSNSKLFADKNKDIVLSLYGSFSPIISDHLLIVSKYDTLLNHKWTIGIDIGFVLGSCYVIQDTDSTYIGASSSYFIGNYGNGDMYLFKVNTNGNFIWSKSIGLNSSTGIEPRDMLISNDNSLMILGTSFYNGQGAFTLSKYGHDGSIQWFKIYKHDSLPMWAGGLCQLENGDYLLCGGISPNGPKNGGGGLIMCVNKDGNIRWCKKIVLIDHLNFTNDLFLNQLIKNNNDIYIYGSPKINYVTYPPYNFFTTQRVLVKIDTNGNIIFLKRYYTNYNEFFNTTVAYYEAGGFRNYIHFTNKNSIFTGGGIFKLPFSTISNQNNQNKILFIMTNLFAKSCSIDTTNYTIKDVSIQQIDSGGIITSINQGTIYTWTPTIIEDGTDSTLCFCYIPGTFSASPANCYTNGSASFTPSYTYNYSYSWSSPISSNSATAANIPPGSYTLTISDSSGCSRTIPFTISANFSLPLSITGNSTICSGQTTTLTLHGAQALTWNTGQTDSSIIVQPFSTTTYSAVAIAGSCTDSIYYTVNVLPSPTLNLSASAYTINIGDTVLVQASGATYYSWSPIFGVLSPNSPTTLITPTATTQYCIIGKDSSQSCTDTACLQLIVEGNCFDFKIPNIFTPNNDNINDTWHISFPCPQLISNFRLSVFDRWGVLLFEANQHNAQWDGRTGSGEPVPTGTYFFTAEFKLNNKKQKLKGYITLLR